MLKCIAVDDEPLALRQIAGYIGKIPYLELAARFNNALDAQQWLAAEKADLIFVDINMPDLNGVDFVRGLVDRPMVVFTTAYSEYAVEGFKTRRRGRLLNPVPASRFQPARPPRPTRSTNCATTSASRSPNRRPCPATGSTSR